MDVEMRHLRALLAVAEELSFTRAAERLHLTQQALSGQIRQLEQRVGARLVERDTRHVELTAAGRALCAEAGPLLSGAERAVEAARQAAARPPVLRVGYIAPLTHRLVAPALQRFSDARPDVDLRIHFGSFLDPLGGLGDKQTDVAILLGQFDHKGLDLRPLFSEPRGVGLPVTHPLAARPRVALAEFLAEPLVEVPVRDAIWSDFWTAAKHRRGTPPRVGARVETLDALIEAIGAGLGVALTVAPVIEALGRSAGVVFRPVQSLEPLDFWVARRCDDDRPHILAFMESTEASVRPVERTDAP